MAHAYVDIPFPHKGFSKVVEDGLLPPDTLAEAANVRVVDGALQGGPVLTQLGTGFDGVTGETLWRADNGDTTTIIATPSALYKWVPDASTWGDITGTVTLTGDLQAPWDFASINGSLFGTNRANGVFRWPGSGNFRTHTLDYRPWLLEGFAGRLFAANLRDPNGIFHDRVRWTDSNLVPQFENGGANDLLDVHGPITGMATIGAALFVFKPTAIWQVTETGLEVPAFRFSLVHQGTGCIGPHTLRRTPKGLMFLGTDYHIYLFDGGTTPVPVSDSIKPYLRKLPTFAPGELHKAWGQWYARLDEYWLTVPNTAASGQWAREILTFNINTGAWGRLQYPSPQLGTTPYTITVLGLVNEATTPLTWNGETALAWDGETARTWDEDVPWGESSFIWFGQGTTNATVEKVGEGLGTGTPGWLLESLDTDLGTPFTEKTAYGAKLKLKAPSGSTSLNLRLSRDGGNTWEVNRTYTLTTTGEWEDQLLPFDANRLTGEEFRLRLQSDEPVHIRKIQLEVDQRGSRVRE